MKPRYRHLTTCLLTVFAATCAVAAWPGDPMINVPVSLTPDDKYDVFAVTDGAGGVIVAWEDLRGSDADIYMQRVSSAGDVVWQSDGEPACAASGYQLLFESSMATTGMTPLVADGQGGAWVVWQDERDWGTNECDIYAQRVDATGQMLLATDGVVVTAGTGMEEQASACSDGAGGIIVAWQDENADPTSCDIRAQRLDGAGNLLWNGGASVPVVEYANDQLNLSICADGTGGAIVAWSDARSDFGDLYAQRLDADGNVLWTTNGVAVCVQTFDQDAITVQLASDGDPLLAWADWRSGGASIYGQKLALADGSSRWTAHGVAFGNLPVQQLQPALCSDGAGGAIVAWDDFRNASSPPYNTDIYAQRFNAAGQRVWPLNGLQVCGGAQGQRDVSVAADGEGGVYVAWEDARAGTNLEDIYAQRVSATGGFAWEQDGRAVSVAPGDQAHPVVVAGADGVIAAWLDDRDEVNDHYVYCDRLTDTVLAAPMTDPRGLAVSVTGGREQGVSLVAFTLAGPAQVSAEIFDVRGRRVRTLSVSTIRAEGRHELIWSHRDDRGQPVESGVYLVRVSAGDEAGVGRTVVIR